MPWCIFFHPCHSHRPRPSIKEILLGASTKYAQYLYHHKGQAMANRVFNQELHRQAQHWGSQFSRITIPDTMNTIAVFMPQNIAICPCKSNFLSQKYNWRFVWDGIAEKNRLICADFGCFPANRIKSANEFEAVRNAIRLPSYLMPFGTPFFVHIKVLFCFSARIQCWK